MPELPEVESLRIYLVECDVIGRTFTSFEADWPGIENTVDGAGGLSKLPGRKIRSIGRIGKNLLVNLDQGVLWLHMGMTGRLGVMLPHDERMKYARTVFYLDDERRIELDDPRRWAGVRLEDSADDIVSGLGPDALDAAFSLDLLHERIANRRAPIKSLLLDQSIVAGIGNIYADEALHRSGISPARPANKITHDELATLHRSIRVTLTQALRFIVDHPDEQGRPYIVDAYDDRMRLRRKKSSVCPDCETDLQTQKLGGRTAYYCPECQA